MRPANKKANRKNRKSQSIQTGFFVGGARCVAAWLFGSNDAPTSVHFPEHKLALQIPRAHQIVGQASQALRLLHL
jgi:hypothetical protein